MLKLKWEKSFDYWKCYSIEGAIMVLVRQRDNVHILPELNGMWEIIIGVRYWSRDANHYFHDVEIAKHQAEILVAAVCRKMLKELEAN